MGEKRDGTRGVGGEGCEERVVEERGEREKVGG
jgi:hypothetical protein